MFTERAGRGMDFYVDGARSECAHLGEHRIWVHYHSWELIVTAKSLTCCPRICEVGMQVLEEVEILRTPRETLAQIYSISRLKIQPPTSFIHLLCDDVYCTAQVSQVR